MATLEPYLNLLVLLTVLSIVSERITNVIKLRSSALRVPHTDPSQEKTRERGITLRSILVGIVVALLMKANLFEILASLDSPWQTLGWVQIDGPRWVRTTASQSSGNFIYSLAGCVITGFALGFGGKFWHDILDSVFELRGIAQRISQKPPASDE